MNINLTQNDGASVNTFNINSLNDAPLGFVPVSVNVGGAGAAAWIDTATGDVELQTLPITSVTVNSITPATFRTASANTVQWTATFSQPIADLTASNFQLHTLGLTQTPTILSVIADSATTGFSNTWTITASTGSGAGVLGLNFVNTTGIFEGYVVTNTLAGQAYALTPRPLQTQHSRW